LPQGAVNSPYGATGQGIILGASGGTGAYTWSIASGSLPPGMTLNSSSGLLSGTPTTLGNYTFTVKVTDAANMSGTGNLSIYIEGVVVVSSTCGTSPVANFCPTGAPQVPYSAQLTASGGTGVYTWCVLANSTCDPTQAALPPGLSLNTSTGLISGTPMADAAPAKFTVQVSDNESSPGIPAVGSAMFTITIMSITTTSLPAGYVGTAYTNPDGSPVQVTVAGGGGPPGKKTLYTWTDDGTLPPRLVLDQSTCMGSTSTTCTIKGTPTTNGVYAVAIAVTDNETPNPAIAKASFAVTVYQASKLILAAMALPPGTEGTPYTATLTASGGLQPYNWSISSGTLPPGLSLDPSTCNNSSVPCMISGTPTASGPYVFTVQVQDSGSGSQQQTAKTQFSILIVNPPPLMITTTSLPAGLVGVPYSGTLAATGGVKPYSWCIFEKNGACDNGAGILPPGLNLDPATCTKSSVPCMITGTPTAGGSFGFILQVQDSGSPQQTVPANLGILINSLGNSTLSGNYVFNFSGYKGGQFVVMAGSFAADGQGHICIVDQTGKCTAMSPGVLDYNDGSGEPTDNNGRPIPQMIEAGSTYSISPSGLGTMTITTDKAVFDFAIAVKSDGSGSLIQNDAQEYGSGMISSHTPLGQSDQWPLCGSPVAIGLFGFDNSLPGRYAAAGQFQFSPPPPQGTCVDILPTGTMDVNDGGTPSNATFLGAFNQYDVSTTRGIAGLTFNGDQNHRYFNPFYLISSSDRKTNILILLTVNVCDSKLNCTGTNPTLWSGLQQASPPAGWSNANLSGTSVAELNALDTTPAADVTAGLLVGKGSSNNNCQNNNYDAATFTFDRNQGGTCNGGMCAQPQSSQGMYCVNKSTARVTLTGFSGAFGATPPIFYLVKTGQAFVVGTDPAVTSGYIEPQSGSPFTNTSLFGLYAGGTIAPITAMVTNSVGTLFADGGGNIQGTQSTSGPGGPQQPPPFTYTYAVDNTGRVLVCASGTCNAQSNNIIGVAYVVSPTKFVLLPATDPNPALSVFGQ
jgi:hypothetical protein